MTTAATSMIGAMFCRSVCSARTAETNTIRPDSPIIVNTYTMNDGSSSTAYHDGVCSVTPPTCTTLPLACAATISDVDSDPENRNTATNDSPIAISYEITCALERSPPS